MTKDEIKIIFELEEKEKNLWKKQIKDLRKKLVKKPSDYVEEILDQKKISKDDVAKNISEFIVYLRENCWAIYLEDEVKFHREIISQLINDRDLPNGILKALLNNNKDVFVNCGVDRDKFYKELSSLIGDFSGRIMPYLYDLSLSTTNSRRARAGKTFETIISHIIKLYKYPFEDQSALGSIFYEKNGLSKIVDGVIPGAASYFDNRSKCTILTMKTTLRERWQEVVEEQKRTNIPHVFLLTLDDNITKGVLDTIRQHNITIVTYDWIKNKFKECKNIISFLYFFNTEIPHTLEYWGWKE